MKDKRCYRCGAKMYKNKDENLICPNHGIIDEEEKISFEKEVSYIG